MSNFNQSKEWFFLPEEKERVTYGFHSICMKILHHFFSCNVTRCTFCVRTATKTIHRTVHYSYPHLKITTTQQIGFSKVTRKTQGENKTNKQTKEKLLLKPFQYLIRLFHRYRDNEWLVFRMELLLIRFSAFSQ